MINITINYIVNYLHIINSAIITQLLKYDMYIILFNIPNPVKYQ